MLHYLQYPEVSSACEGTSFFSVVLSSPFKLELPFRINLFEFSRMFTKGLLLDVYLCCLDFCVLANVLGFLFLTLTSLSPKNLKKKKEKIFWPSLFSFSGMVLGYSPLPLISGLLLRFCVC